MIWTFETLFYGQTTIFVILQIRMAGKESVTMEDLKTYPYLSFGRETQLFYFSEENSVLQSVRRYIRVRDRATLFNLLNWTE